MTLLQNKAPVSSFCMVGRNPFYSSVSFRIFFRYCRSIQFLKLFRLQSKSLICRGKKSLKINLNPLITDLRCPVNFNANFNFAIHQSKTFIMILVNTFDVSSLMLVKKQWCLVMLFVCSILLNWRLLKTLVKHYVTTKFPWQTITILLRVPTKKFGLH